MPWQLFGLASVLTVSIANLLERVLMKEDKSDPVGYAIVFQFLLGLMAFLFALLFGRFSLPPLLTMPYQFALSTVLWATATVFTFKAAKKLGAGEITILYSFASLVTVTLGILVLHESVTIHTSIGILLILLAVGIVSSEKLSFSSKLGILFTLISASCSGIAVINDAIILKSYEAFSYTAVMSILPGILLLVLFPQHLKKVPVFSSKKFVLTMMIFTFFYTIQAITYYLAFQYGAPASQLSPLIRTSVVLTVIFAAIFLKERSHIVKKAIAAIMTTIGVILLG